ncbi:alpha-hydroxy acid oxidase [Deinococcus sp. YIM 77859]|uniref:alpha-hydroxy acid oxidase n=1 Tax=Deinococcus sp. YIM 77859 TaxID=1540221 RepID=UPI000AC4C8D4|nr:alpha-hydroxy acid oxidase [Deinococcus sp. YIM 77859]
MTTNLPELDGTVNLADLEAIGKSRLDQGALEYYASGANDEVTLQENRAGFRRLRLRPRVLVDVSDVDTRTEVLGLPLSFPVGIAPSAFHGLAHPDAELGTARAAASKGSLLTLSTFSNTPIEAVAAAAPGRFWFQLYLYTDREASADIIRRAEAAGARALVLTVDTPFVGRREPNERHRFALPPHLSVPNAGSREQLTALESASGSQLVMTPRLKAGACVWTPPQLRVPLQACGFGFSVRHISPSRPSVRVCAFGATGGA